MNAIKDFFTNLLSADESKKSIVVMVLIAVSAFGLYKSQTSGDIPSNMTTIILTISGFIFGMNGIKAITNSISDTKKLQNGDNSHSNGENGSV